jgi:hypothetical protein
MQTTLTEAICEIIGRKALTATEVARVVQAQGRMNADVPERQAWAYIASVLASATHGDRSKVFCHAAYDRKRYRVANHLDRMIQRQLAAIEDQLDALICSPEGEQFRNVPPGKRKAALHRLYKLFPSVHRRTYLMLFSRLSAPPPHRRTRRRNDAARQAEQRS